MPLSEDNPLVNRDVIRVFLTVFARPIPFFVEDFSVECSIRSSMVLFNLLVDPEVSLFVCSAFLDLGFVDLVTAKLRNLRSDQDMLHVYKLMALFCELLPTASPAAVPCFLQLVPHIAFLLKNSVSLDGSLELLHCLLTVVRSDASVRVRAIECDIPDILARKSSVQSFGAILRVANVLCGEEFLPAFGSRDFIRKCEDFMPKLDDAGLHEIFAFAIGIIRNNWFPMNRAIFFRSLLGIAAGASFRGKVECAQSILDAFDIVRGLDDEEVIGNALILLLELVGELPQEMTLGALRVVRDCFDRNPMIVCANVPFLDALEDLATSAQPQIEEIAAALLARIEEQSSPAHGVFTIG
jgi:hypothetical protein